MTAREAHWGTVVLTGATSGIGEATARRLAGRADELIVQGPEPDDEVAEVLAGIRASGGAHVWYLSVDFTSLTAVAEAARAVREAVSTDRVVPTSAVSRDPGNRRRLADLYMDRLPRFAS